MVGRYTKRLNIADFDVEAPLRFDERVALGEHGELHVRSVRRRVMTGSSEPLRTETTRRGEIASWFPNDRLGIRAWTELRRLLPIWCSASTWSALSLSTGRVIVIDGDHPILIARASQVLEAERLLDAEEMPVTRHF